MGCGPTHSDRDCGYVWALYSRPFTANDILTLGLLSIMMADMRTTLTLDDDVARLVEDAVHRQRRPMKQIVNDALRQALAPRIPRQEPYHLVPHESSVRPGFDPAGFNRLADELEDEAIIDKARHAS